MFGVYFGFLEEDEILFIDLFFLLFGLFVGCGFYWCKLRKRNGGLVINCCYF